MAHCDMISWLRKWDLNARKNVTFFWFRFLILYLGHRGMLVYNLLSVSHVLIHRTHCLQCLNVILRYISTTIKLFLDNKWVVSRARSTALFTTAFSLTVDSRSLVEHRTLERRKGSVTLDHNLVA